MKKSYKKTVAMTTLLVIGVFLFSCITVNAASSKTWKSLYKSYLATPYHTISTSNGSRYVDYSDAYFSLADINFDGVKELIVTNRDFIDFDVFTIKSKKVKYAGTVYQVGTAPKISKKYKVIYSTWYAAGCTQANYYGLKNGKLYEKKSIFRYTDPRTEYYSVDNKTVSKKTYETQYKAYEKSLKKGMSFVKNDRWNRARYL